MRPLNSKIIPRLISILFLIPLALLCLRCGGAPASGSSDDSNNGGDGGVGAFPGIRFSAVGSALPSNDLIDLEFLPGQNGEALLIGQGGEVYYLRSDFTPLSQSASIPVEYSGEQGLLNVAADPDYASNHFVYFYFTLPGGGVNRVARASVSATPASDLFSLSDFQTILDFDKSYSPSPGDNHNGGGLIFENAQNLFISVGDGGGASSTDTNVAISQDGQTRLGKLLRVVPSRVPGAGGYSIPSGGNNPGGNLPEIYATGLRNPFTLAFGNSALYIGDVGADLYEEVDWANAAGLNFGWPLTEGPTSNSAFRSPLQSYAHSDDTFVNEDPDAHASGSLSALRQNHNGVDHGDASKSVLVLHFYHGDQYNGFLSNRLLYADFYLGWIRGLQLDASNHIQDDDHLGHLTGLTSLQEGPDGFLYGVSLYGSDQILRLELDQ